MCKALPSCSSLAVLMSNRLNNTSRLRKTHAFVKVSACCASDVEQEMLNTAEQQDWSTCLGQMYIYNY